MNQMLESIASVRIIPHELHFRNPARTSRSILHSRRVYFVMVAESDGSAGPVGWGEAAPIDGLSPENDLFYLQIGQLLYESIPAVTVDSLLEYPSFRFAVEAACHDLDQGGRRLWFDGPFAQGDSSIPINGLIWMGDKATMYQQIKQKLDMGYPCLKLKIGGIHFDEELELLKYIRKEFSPDHLELRLDANGSFPKKNAEERLEKLSEFSIHSIEQPIRAGQTESMAALCEMNIIPIALDEELIGIKSTAEKETLIQTIQPQYMIFKPSLIGGLSETKEYISLCEKKNTGWWITSALESNVGLNVLAQFCDHLRVNCVQGLGTGKLFTNNIGSPLREEKGRVFTDPKGQWEEIMDKQ